VTRASLSIVAVIAVVALALAACSAAPSAVAPQSVPAVDASAPTGVAKLEGAVQRISVDLSQGFYDPTVIEAKAGMPLEITFGQGQGCLSSVLVPSAGIDQDLTQGGAVVKLPAMQPGEYEFSCGMKMVFGKIVVK
jgi:plastocyanin domain-containing protein